MKFLAFCENEPAADLVRTSDADPSECSLFDPTVTKRGLCHTYNGLPMTDVFKESPVVNLWRKAFKPRDFVELVHPTGPGPNVIKLFTAVIYEFS